MSTAPIAPVPLEIAASGRTWTVRPDEVFTMGRDRSCTLVLDDARVSRKHAWFQHGPDGWTLHSQGGNGTFVAGSRVDRHRVSGVVAFRLGDAAGPEVTARPALTAPAPVPAAPAAPARQRPQEAMGQAYDPIRTSDSQGPESMSIRIGGAMLAPQVPAPGTARPPMAPPPSQQQAMAQAPAPGAGPGGQAVAVPHSGQGAITIGRGRDNVIVVDDLLVSRHHTRVTPNGRGGYRVEDLGSRNGTYVNGSRVATADLGPGDLLSVGHSQFRVQGGRLVASVDQGNVPFVAANISFVLPSGKKLLDDVSFSADGATLTAVIGPSGAGKSTILNALTGNRPATTGRVFYDNRDLYQNYDDLRHRIGLVPQDDVVHRQLNVRQALNYAAELRFPDDLDKKLREQRVDEVIGELELTQHVDTRIDKLSGGQRKRVSVALELLTRPSLLFLDEPTSGLDPGLDKQVMNLLRTLADGGRTVFVVTHSVANLDVCDRVLLLAPGGKVAYYGPPQEMLRFFGAADHADIFTLCTNDPEGMKQRFLHSPLYGRYVAQEMHKSMPQGGPQRPLEPSRQQSIPRQLSTLIRRHLKVILADRSYAAFMLIMPVVLALLAIIMPAKIGFSIPGREQLATTRYDPPVPQQISQLLLVLIIGAAFMGAAASSRELVSERAIWLRERSVGLSPWAYLLGKVFVFFLLSVVQAGILVGVVMLVKKRPTESALLGSGIAEILIACIVTAFVCAIVGLLLSAFVATNEQVMPLLVVFIMIQLVLCGGLFALQDQTALNIVSWLSPARWGFAATAGTVDLNTVIKTKDDLWKPDMYLLDLVVVLGLGVVIAFLTLLKLKAKPKR